jgi:hypothetical protein
MAELKSANHGQDRDLIFTEQEREIFENRA